MNEQSLPTLAAAPTPARRLALVEQLGFAGGPSAGGLRREALAAACERWLTQLWSSATGAEPVTGRALAAVGSLARRDAGPLSDWDLVLIYEGRSGRGIADLADQLWYPIWDLGIRLDHSVRSVAECRSVAADDLSASIGLLDLHLIAGDPEVVERARSHVAQDWRAGARTRLGDLLESLAARHERYDDLAQSVEPNLKEARGGLRDITIMAALEQAWLAQSPRAELVGPHQWLLQIRDAHQVVTGRARDGLGRAEQADVAHLLGLADEDELLTQTSRAGRAIGHAADQVIRRASQSQRARRLRVGPRKPRLTSLGFGVYESDGEVVLGAGVRPEDDSLLPLRVASLAARASLPISPTTLTNLATKSPPLHAPWPTAARELFTDLLGAGPGLVATWESVQSVGLIQRWLPQWEAIVSRPQRSPIHRHTVDRHSLETVVAATSLAGEVARPDLLLVAALFHDIGKQPNAGDHSEFGAPIAAAAAIDLGFDSADGEVIRALVAHHLTLMDLATTRDASDPATAHEAVAAVDGSLSQYELLYALTQADAQAAGPLAWSSWRATLLRQLDACVRRAFEGRTSDGPADDDSLTGPAPDAALLTEAGPDVTVRILGGAQGADTTWRVTVNELSRADLFADIAALLDRDKLAVRSARLRVRGGVCISAWDVDSTSDAPDPAALARRLLARRTAGDARGSEPSTNRTTGGQSISSVVEHPFASERATVVEVRAVDRRGLIGDLARAVSGLGMGIRSAHLSTLAGRAVDVFYLCHDDGPLTPEQTEQVLAAVWQLNEPAVEHGLQ